MRINTLSLDIETYGILEGWQQTVFHPAKMLSIDKVKPQDVIQTVAVAPRMEGEPVTKQPEAWVYVWKEPKHRQHFLDWIDTLTSQPEPGTLLCQNILFDVGVLFAFCPEFREMVEPYRRCFLDDLMIVNFLEYEERPEKALKPLAMLYGLDDYPDEVTGSKATAKDAWDTRLHKYNARDAIRTLQLYETLWGDIQSRTPTSQKLSPLCRSHRDRLIRIGLEMSEAGLYMDYKKLRMAKMQAEAKARTLAAEAKTKYGLVIKGKGSAKAKYAMIRKAVTPELLMHPRLQLTEKTLDISFAEQNLVLVLSEQPEDHPGIEECKLVYQHSKVDHIITSYLKPLITKPSVGLSLGATGSCAYASWMLVPRPIGKGKVDEDRGTKQGRITAIGPGIQTFPPMIKKTCVSRFMEGKLIAWDYKAIEMRVAAMLSCDPVMLQEYKDGIDQHTKTTKTKILKPIGMDVPETDPSFRKVWRQAGKRLNFLTLYKGGAYAYRQALLKDAVRADNYEVLRLFDKVMTVDACQAALDEYDKEYWVFRAWQESNIQRAIREGGMEVPTGWARTFTGGETMVRELMESEICNFPIQCLAAQLVQDAQMECLLWLRKNRMKTRICSQTYDSIKFDVHPREVEQVASEVPKLLTCPPLLSIIDKSGGQVPLEIEQE